MSITVADIQTSMNTYLGDAGTQRISAAQRLDAITEATFWLQEILRNDFQNATYQFNFYDTVHYYKVTTSIANLLEAVDMRKPENTQYQQWSYKNPREIAIDISQKNTGDIFSIERRDDNAYLVINHRPKYYAKTISGFNSLTDGGGTWAVDSVNSDANTLAVDTVTYKEGTASLSFNVTVAQSANNRATLYNSTLSALDFTTYLNSASFLMWVWIPSTTNFSSVTLYWGTDSSNYYSATVTTDIDGAAFTAGNWSRLQWLWTNASVTGSPTITSMGYFRIDFNYTGSYTDQSAFRVDDFLVCNPETLTFHYTSQSVGKNSGGTPITVFTATTDVPYFSGKYDAFKFAVAHMATSILYDSPLRLQTEANQEATRAMAAAERASKIIPSSAITQTTAFRPHGISFNRRANRKGRH